jgi:chromosomal replication initiation ATPase DnaA
MADIGEFEASLANHYREVRERLAAPLVVPKVRQPLSPHEQTMAIIHEVCRRHGVSLAQLTTKGIRPRHVAIARWEAFYRLREERCLALGHIGEIMGGFDHTTVLYGYKKHKQRLTGKKA